jgi:hypothetical protein
MNTPQARPFALRGFCRRASILALPIGLGAAIAVSNDVAAGVAVGVGHWVVFWRASR